MDFTGQDLADNTSPAIATACVFCNIKPELQKIVCMKQHYFPSGRQTRGNVIDLNTSQRILIACWALFMYFPCVNIACHNDLYIKGKNGKQLPQVVPLNKEHSIFPFCILLRGNWNPKSLSITLTVNLIRMNWHLFVVASILTDNCWLTLSIYATILVLYATTDIWSFKSNSVQS